VSGADSSTSPEAGDANSGVPDASTAPDGKAGEGGTISNGAAGVFTRPDARQHRDFGMSLVKLSATGSVVDWFAPHDAMGLYLYLVNRDRMGHFNAAGDTQIVQKVSVKPNAADTLSGIFATPAYFGGQLYVAAADDSIKAFSVTAGMLSATPVSHTAATFGYPGAMLSVSSNGSAAGILWALQGDGCSPRNPAVLLAYDATDLTKQLYASNQAAALRDVAGPAVKFAVPTVVNGHVYVGTQTELDVYGELP
jgi:hypothetical protein